MTSYWGIWGDVPNHLVRLSLAFAFAFPLGWNREREARSAGLRTFPIVSISSCGFILLAGELLGERTPEQSRILQGLITGIGFIGGGAIFKSGDNVHGTATAASLWNVGVIGAAVGFGYYDLGLILALGNLLVFTLLTPMKHRTKAHRSEDQNPGDEPTRARATVSEPERAE